LIAIRKFRIVVLLFVVAALISFGAISFSSALAQTAPTTLRVETFVIPPFVIEQDGPHCTDRLSSEASTALRWVAPIRPLPRRLGSIQPTRGYNLPFDPLDGSGPNAQYAGGLENTGSLCQLSLHPLLDFRGDPGPAKLNVVCLSSLETSHDPLAYHRALELGEHTHHLKEGSSCRRRGIDRLLMEIQADFESMDLR
jgi:hypothetical protein